MAVYLGIDTSNYTTSAAAFDDVSGCVFQKKMLLPVKSGERGLRQSDACFIIHSSSGRSFLLLSTSAVSLILSARHMLRVMQRARICRALPSDSIPRSASHLPWACRFMNSRIRRVMSRRLSIRAGILNFLTASYRVPCLRRNDRALLVRPNEEKLLNIDIIGRTLDLNAGQAVDRVGVAMGLKFLRAQNSKNWRSKAKKYSSRNPASRAQTAAFRVLKTSASI